MSAGLVGLFALVGGAWAATPVVVDSEAPGVALARAAQRTGVPEGQLEAVSLRDLLDQRPSALGAATLRHCAGEPATRDEIRAAVVRAEAAWRSMNLPEALDHLDLGMARLGCLTERVEPAVAARLFLLRGGILARASELDAAQGELRTALSLTPEATYDEWLPSEGRGALDDLRDEDARATIALSPSAAANGPWIDGALPAPGTSDVALRPGLHLVQVASTAGLQSAWLTVSGDGALVVPRSFKRPILEHLGGDDAPQKRSVEHLLQAALSSQPVAYTAHSGGLWMTTWTDGGPQTDTLIAPPPPTVAEDCDRRCQRRKAREERAGR